MRAVLILFLMLAAEVSAATMYAFAFGMGLLWLSTSAAHPGAGGADLRRAPRLRCWAGVVFFGHQIGSFCGAWLAGHLYDTTGTYQGAFMASIGSACSPRSSTCR